MNERVIVLYEEAMLFASGKVPEFNSGLWQAVCAGRFAELIIDECARLADLKESGYGIYAHDVTAGEHLRDYFGTNR
jgi:hypothetical protein